MRHLRLALRALPVLLSSLWTGLALAAPPDHVPGQIIVKLRAAKAGAALPSLRDVADRRIGVMRPRLTRVDARASVLELDGASRQATLNAISALRVGAATTTAHTGDISSRQLRRGRGRASGFATSGSSGQLWRG